MYQLELDKVDSKSDVSKIEEQTNLLKKLREDAVQCISIDGGKIIFITESEKIAKKYGFRKE